MKRNLIVVIFVAVLMATAFLLKFQPAETSASSLSTSINLGQAAGFLEQLYNPSMELCRETLVEENETFVASNGTRYYRLTNETCWIASDNFFESLALRPHNLTLSENISRTCSRYYNGSYFPYQIINGSNIPLTLHVANTYVLENTSDHIIALNLYNGTVDSSNFVDYPTCGDTLVYEALNYYVQGYPLDWCNNLYMEAYNMFDGKGVADSAFSNPSSSGYHEYANMKLALLVFGAQVLNLNVNLTGIEKQLQSAQNISGSEMGGITSLMNGSGQPVGTANGETTALTLLAYDDNLISQIRSEGERARATGPKDFINIVFPAACVNQTTSTTTNLAAIPSLDNWTVAFNNTVQWASPMDNPRVALGFYSSLANSGNLSIQLIEYNNNAMDVVIHNATYSNGFKISPAGLNWSNPLNVSLVSGNLSISSSNGMLLTYVFQSSNLTYITIGSTQAEICSGGEVDLQVIPEFSHLLILPLFMIATLLVGIVYKEKNMKTNQ